MELSSTTAFYWMLSASLTIAAAGYIINDYFDLRIDMLNKPGKIILEKKIKRRWAIIFHLLLSLIGIICSFMASKLTGQWLILVGNTICVFLLWFYSTHFKRMLLTGNIVIALLIAWVFVVMYFLIYPSYATSLSHAGISMSVFKPFLFKTIISYAGFAFILTLVREVIKDLEDMHGDATYQCKTMPIVWGVPVSKIYAAVWILVCAASVCIIGLYLFMQGWWLASLYLFILIAIPLLLSLRKLRLASQTKDYHLISRELKMIMLAGILTMIFFKFIQ